MRGSRFSDINDITVQVHQHKAYQKHKQRLEQIGNGQIGGGTSPRHSFILGSGNLTSPRMGSLRGTQRQGSKNWSPMVDSPRAKLAAAMAASGGAGGRKVISSLEVNLGRSILNNQNNIRNAGLEIEQKYLNSKQLQSIEYREIEKLNQIQRENEILLEKLISISKGQQLSVPHHLLNSSSRLIHNGSNLNNMPTEGSQPSPRQKHHGSQSSAKKLRTLNMVQKKLEAQRIDQENLFLLSRITQVQSNLDKVKLQKDWSKQEQYRQMIQRTNRKSDLEKVIMKRQGFLEKNYDILPRIFPHQTSRSALLQEVPEGGNFESMNFSANPQAAATIEEDSYTPAKATFPKKPNFRSKTRLSMPHAPLRQLEPIRGAQIQVLGSTDLRNSVDSKPAYHLNLNAISSLDIKRHGPKQGKKDSARRIANLNEYSKKDLFSNQQSARSISNTKRHIFNPTDSSVQEELDTNQLEEDENIVKGVLDQATHHSLGIADPIRPFLNHHQGKQKMTRKNAREANKTDMYQRIEEATGKSKEVIINQSNPVIIPITVTQDGLLGVNQTPAAEKSPIVSMINKSSNTTLGAPVAGQQSQTKLYQNMRYQQYQSSPRQHATLMRIANKMLPSLSKTRFGNKISNSPSNNITLFDSSIKDEAVKGKSTQRESMNLINRGQGTWQRDMQAQSVLDQLNALPPYVFRKGDQLLMPASNILASIHLKEYKKGKSPFGVKAAKHFYSHKNAIIRRKAVQVAQDETLERALLDRELGPGDIRERNSNYEDDRFEEQSPIGASNPEDGRVTFDRK